MSRRVRTNDAEKLVNDLIVKNLTSKWSYDDVYIKIGVHGEDGWARVQRQQQEAGRGHHTAAGGRVPLLVEFDPNDPFHAYKNSVRLPFAVVPDDWVRKKRERGESKSEALFMHHRFGLGALSGLFLVHFAPTLSSLSAAFSRQK